VKTDANVSRNRKSGGYLLKSRLRKGAVSVIRGLLLFGLCFMIIQPILSRIGISLMTESDLYDSTIVLLPRHVTLENYKIVFDLTSFLRKDFPYLDSMLNTLWVSLVVSLLQVVACTLVGYGFARYNFPLKKFWFGCVIAVIIIPPQTISIALYANFNAFDPFGLFTALTGKPLNMLNSTVPYMLMSLTCMGLKDGLYIYMLRTYFQGIPKSLEEAAFVDGCSTMHTFVRIMLPDAVPTIASCFLFSFVWQWTDLFYTRNFFKSINMYSTKLQGMTSQMTRYFSQGTNSSVIVAQAREQQLLNIGVLICIIPLIILYVFTQKTFVQSIAMSGSKE